MFSILSDIQERSADDSRDFYCKFHLMNVSGESRLIVRKGLLFQPKLAMIPRAEMESVVNNLFQPHDITHIKSIFRRILLDMANQKTRNLTEEEKDEQLRNDVA